MASVAQKAKQRQAAAHTVTQEQESTERQLRAANHIIANLKQERAADKAHIQHLDGEAEEWYDEFVVEQERGNKYALASLVLTAFLGISLTFNVIKALA